MTTPSVNDDRSTSPTILRYLPPLVAGLYVAGFIVTNAGTAQVERVDPDLLQARYLSAGLLFLVLGGFPMACGALWSSRRSKPEGTAAVTPTRFDLFKASPRAQLALLTLYIILWYLVLLQVAVAVNYPMAAVFLVVAFLAGKQLIDVVELARKRALGTAAPSNQQLLFNAINSTVLVLSTLGLFSSTMYGDAKPEFGGGATWLVQVDFKDAQLSSTIGQHPVAIVSEANDRAQLIYCTDSLSEHHLSIPLDELGAVRTLRKREGWPAHAIMDVRVPLSAAMCRFILRHSLNAKP